MSNLDSTDFDDDSRDGDGQDQGPAALRAALKAAQKAQKEAAAELASLRAEKRTETVSKVLQDSGAKPGLAKFIPEDIKDADGVQAWLKENGELFGFTATDSGSSKDTSGNDDTSAPSEMDDFLSTVPAAFREQFLRIQQGEASGQTVTPTGKPDEFLAKLRDAGSYDNALALLAKGE